MDEKDTVSINPGLMELPAGAWLARSHRSIEQHIIN
jgi:hypothetical protein